MTPLFVQSSARVRDFFGKDIFDVRFRDAEVMNACFTTDVPTWSEHQEWLARQYPRLFYFLIDAETVNFMGTVRGTWLSAGVVEIHIALHQDYRGHNIGGWAVDKFCQAMTGLQVREVRACVKLNGRIKRYVFWMRNGFAPIQTQQSGCVWLRRKLG